MNIDNIDPYTFTGSAYLIGLILVNDLSQAEQDSIGNWLQLVGLTIQTYASQQAVIDSTNENDDISMIKKSIEKINDELEKYLKK